MWKAVIERDQNRVFESKNLKDLYCMMKDKVHYDEAIYFYYDDKFHFIFDLTGFYDSLTWW